MEKVDAKPKTKTKSQPNKKTQVGRFVETARKLGCDESEEAFDHAFKKIVSEKRRPSR